MNARQLVDKLFESGEILPGQCTQEQKDAYNELVKRRNRPNAVWYDTIVNVLMVRYDHETIGIETDGYTHS